MVKIPAELKRLGFMAVFNAATYVLVKWCTGFALLAVVCAVISGVLAAAEWDQMQQRKARRLAATDEEKTDA